MIGFSTATDLQVKTLYSVLRMYKNLIDSDLISPELIFDNPDFSLEVDRLFMAVENCSIDRGLI